METLERIKADLRGLGEIMSRSLFDGQGIYRNGVRFGILYRGRLYFKVSGESKEDYLARGMGPFRPNERQSLKSHFEVPPEVLDDQEVLLSWAREAVRSGQQSQEPVR
jgi:DNA transformation protein and related proteins